MQCLTLGCYRNPSAPTACARGEMLCGWGLRRAAGDAWSWCCSGGVGWRWQVTAAELDKPRASPLECVPAPSTSRTEQKPSETLLSKGGGRKVFSCAPNSAHDLLELRKERKMQESLGFKELAWPGFYFEMLTNWASNLEGRANWASNIEISRCTKPSFWF